MPVGQFLSNQDLHLAGRRFAVILADARGSGASGGSRISEFSPDEISDLGELVDWAVRQPWSDGRVGNYGASYEGAAAELTAVSKPRGLRAVAPLFAGFDLEGLIWPGGVYSRVVADWSTSVSALDRNDVCDVYEVGGWHCFLKRLVSGGVKPVDADTRGEHLAELIAQRHNEYPDRAQRNLEFRDDKFNTPRGNMRVDELSAYGHRKEIENSGVVMQVWCGWLDSQLCENSLQRFKTFHNPQEVIITPPSHGGFYNIDPFASTHVPPVPSMDEQDGQLADFFHTLRMCGVESVSDLDAQIEHQFDLQRLASDPVPKRLPFQQFHRDKGSPIGLVDLVDCADVRVVQGGRSLGFSLEAAESLRIVGKFVGKELKGDVATELQVFGFVDDAHAPAADLAEDAVMGNRLPHWLGGRDHWLHMLGGVLSKGQLQGESLSSSRRC
jgi:hypothetical protein